MFNLEDYVSHYVAQLAGPNHENAWHSLVEVGSTALPLVVEALGAASDPRVRFSLVTVISEYRSAEAVPVLGRLLRDRNAGIWKAALDGLVTAGGQAALDALASAKADAGPQQREWIDEAVGQITEARRPG